MSADALEPVTARRAARERAISFLYEAETRQCPVHDVIDALPLRPDPFAIEVAEGVDEHRDEIDELLSEHAHGWSVVRMPAMDRAILRLGVFELGHRPDVPTGVAISEAVELAAAYSTERSAPFVNGVLVAVAGELRPNVE